MPKSTNRAPPTFLLRKLEDRKMKLVRGQFPVWLEQMKEELGHEPYMSMEVLGDFLDHLGFKDKQFRSIDVDTLKTTQKGTLQVYDYMRKRIGKLDEKPATPVPVPQKTKAKATPPKIRATRETADRAKPAKDDQAVDQDAVQVTADGHYGGAEEKKMKYRQREPSSDSVEPSESSDAGSDPESASIS